MGLCIFAREEKELFDRQDFLSEVRKNYEKAFSSLPEGVCLIRIDGTLSPQDVEAEIRKGLSPYRL